MAAAAIRPLKAGSSAAGVPSLQGHSTPGAPPGVCEAGQAICFDMLSVVDHSLVTFTSPIDNL
jgi:hypothetical protein